VDKNALISQYNNTFAHLLEHKKHIWQIPATNATIVGVLVGLAFSLPQEVHWAIREMILIIGTLLSLALLSKLIKHRYFSHIWSETINKIEGELGLKKVQMTTDCKEGDYWYSEQPRRRLESWRSDNVVVNCMWVVFILLTCSLIATPILAIKGVL
jgi:hypothetical protein